jgi:hypothetical protein
MIWIVLVLGYGWGEFVIAIPNVRTTADIVCIGSLGLVRGPNEPRTKGLMFL